MFQKPAGITSKQIADHPSISLLDWQKSLRKNNQEKHKNQSMLFMYKKIDPVKLAFKEGVWIRFLSAYGRSPQEAIEREVNILSKRTNLPNNVLSTHAPYLNITENPEYYFSPATLVKENLHIRLFGSGEKGFGVIIKPNSTIPAWCYGDHHQIMTEPGNDVDFSSQKLHFNGYPEEHQCNDKTSKEISIQLQKLYKKDHQRYKKSLFPNETEGEFPFICNYNEGLFRYKKTEIIGFYVGKTPEDAYNVIKLREQLKLNHLKFYRYNSNFGSIKILSNEEVFNASKNHIASSSNENYSQSESSNDDPLKLKMLMNIRD